MNLKKLNSLLQMALRFPQIIQEEAFEQIVGQKISDPKWDVLMRHYVDLDGLTEKYDLTYEKINEEYALVRVDKTQIDALSSQPGVIYLELPMVMDYILNQALPDICVTQKTVNPKAFGLSGKGIIVGVVDSGIDYFHPDFRKADGTTRILKLWDQTVPGRVYTAEEINRALMQPTREEALAIVPQQDTMGHGTAITGVAAGNGRASLGKYTGVAPEADLMIVKASNANSPTNEGMIEGKSLTRNVDIMRGISFIIDEAIERAQPASIMFGYGLNEGTHDGKNSMEIFINQTSVVGQNNLVVGTGNQANKDNHTSGKLAQGEIKDIAIFIDENQPYYLMVLVKPFSDQVSVKLLSPTGEQTERLTGDVANRAYIFGNTGVTINFSGPDPNTSLQQMTLLLTGFEAEQVNSGIWTLQIEGLSVIEGDYDIWASSIDPFTRLTRFLQPDPLMTLTVPSTAERITSVGGLNQATKQTMPFSGRGYTIDERVKPDIVAPSNQVTAPTSLIPDGYQNATGTSIAAAFMTGGYALLLEYGMSQNTGYLIYGEELKAWVIRTATRLPQYAPYPNPLFGYGILCVDEALEALKRRYKG